MTRSLLPWAVAASLAFPWPAFALYHVVGTPGRSELAPGRSQAADERGVSPSPTASPEATATPRPRVFGFITGMKNKLTNLSNRLQKHLENFERRIAALTQAGHTITVDVELSAARAAVASAQAEIAKIQSALDALPTAERPKSAVREVREQLRGLRRTLRSVRAAFQDLREAIRDDVRAGRPSPNPETSPTPSPVTSPTP